MEGTMRGQIISAEYQNIAWVRDDDGKEYVCYKNKIQHDGHLTEDDKKACLDTSLVLGDSW